MNAQAHIAERVRERVRLDGVDLGADRELAAKYVHDEVRRYSERALGGSLPLVEDEAETARQVVANLTGLGPLQPYLDDPDVEELWINAPDRVLASPTCLAHTLFECPSRPTRNPRSTGRSSSRRASWGSGRW